MLASDSNVSSSAADVCADAPGTLPKVLVIGGNGKTGSRLVKILKSSGKFAPTAMLLSESQKGPFEELGIATVVADVSEGPLAHAMEGMDAVIFAAGAGNHRGPLKQALVDYSGAIRAVVAAQESSSVNRFVLLSGINTDYRGTVRSHDATDFSGPLAAWHKLKAHSETYLRESHLYGRALNWTIVCPGRLLDDPDKPGTGLIKASSIHGEDDLKASLDEAERAAAVKILPGSHDGKMERLCCSRDNVAAAMAAVLEHPNTIGKTFTLVDGILPIPAALEVL